jgi:hypothetical integral membrane protein (TIGR02206 family)
MFKLFGGSHLITLGLLAGMGLLTICTCHRGSSLTRVWVGRLLGLVLIGYAATIYLLKGIDGELSWQYALPLEFCHWVMFAVVISLFRPTPILSEIAYFWGAAGTLQATLTPDITQGFPSWEFILFFWSHGGILLAILFLFVGQNFRPRRGSIWRMMLAANLYAATVGILDKLFGWNYGYLCGKPYQPSLMDYLGPWPWYLVSLEFIALLSFWLLGLPWRIIEVRRLRFAGRSQSTQD